MVSDLLRAHSDVLSLSQFFIQLYGPRFQEGLLDGSQFWQLLSAANPYITMMLRHGLTFPQFLYPVSTTSRYTLETGIPGILGTALPYLTDDYETVYDELQLAVSEFPPDSIDGHYTRLFAWLKRRFGRKVCVERSGISLPLVPELARLFPDAKFLHIARDGRACALSMSRHHGFRLMAILMLLKEALGIDPTTSNDRTKIDALSKDLQRLLPENFDIDVYQAYDIPIEVFGKMWSQLMITGVRSLLALPEEQVMTISYEQLLAEPERYMKQMMTFIDPSLPTDGWISSTSTLIRQTASPIAGKFTLEEDSALETACSPGQAILEVLKKEGLRSARLQDVLQTLRS
jgi:putative sulfotransferase